MIFEDRVSSYPNRYALIDQNGVVSYVVLERADAPTKTGTPLNAETFNNMLAGLEPAVESDEYPGCYYRMVGDEKEWINPPMVASVPPLLASTHEVVTHEYRTTERWNGLPVYTMLVYCGNLPNNTSIGIDISKMAIGATRAIFANGTTSYGQVIPFVETSDHYQTITVTPIDLYVNKAVIIIRTHTDRSTQTAYVTVKYVKEVQ